ncbi:MAG: hypothetical protein H0W35_03915 [Actinobacteria bacterium]|nr:hypothetical protein [Actinomycetota bacterium]
MSDATRRKVDAVASHDPVGLLVELDIYRESSAPTVFSELPDESRPVHTGRAITSLVPLQVVDDPAPFFGLDALGPLVQREDQWKY